MNLIIVLDFETGGLESEKCAITQLSAVAGFIDKGQFDEVDSFNSYVKPGKWLYVSQGAMNVQGRTAADIFDSKHPEEKDVFSEFYAWVSAQKDAHGEVAFYAHNAPFDEGFMLAMQKRADIGSWMFYRGAFLCTKQAYQTAQLHGKMPKGSPSLDTICELHNIEKAGSGQHDALQDARAAAIVLAMVESK